MNVIVCNIYGLYTPHLETDLELIQNHLDAGDSVTVLECDSELLSCEVNQNHETLWCARCKSKRRNGLSRLAGSFHREPLLRLTPGNQRELRSLPLVFDNTQDMKSFKVENFDAGYSVLSSIVSLLRDPKPDPRKHRDLIRNLLISSVAVYRSMQRHLEKNCVDRVYIYNGRYAPLRAVVRACESRNVRFFTHERGSNLYRYALYENTLPHDRENLSRLIRQAWDDARERADREAIAEQFFLDREKGVVQSWLTFVEGQKAGLLPPEWDPNHKNIAIFSSSDDEFVAIGESWTNPIYRNQNDAIRRIIISLSTLKSEYHLFLRLHPNLKNVRSSSLDEMLRSGTSRFTIVPPDAPVSSYAMLRAADKVLTFGSTMGIEATFWGIPSILAGVSMYEDLGGTYNPKDHEEVIAMMNTDLMPGNREAALIYGYYMNTFGIPFLHFKPTGILEGEFAGEPLEADAGTGRLESFASRFPRIQSAGNRFARGIARWRLTGRLLDPR